MKYIGKFIGMLVAGLVLVGVGVVIVATSFPRTDGLGNSTGSSGAMVFGLILVAVGQMVFLIGTIALGVFLGVREANYERAGV